MGDSFNDDDNERRTSTSNSTRPWNLRMQRAVCKASTTGNGKSASCNSLESPVAPPAKSSRFKGLAAAAATTSKQGVEKEEKIERLMFSISLTREEIERDFLKMTGIKPPRRPTKRPKAIQRQLDTLVLRAWLMEITPESYKVLNSWYRCFV